MSELARLTGNSDVITVHVDDQMDSKTLLGSYIATTTPGEFVWQPGLLTQASPFGMPTQTPVSQWGRGGS